MYKKGPYKNPVTSNYILEERMRIKKGGKIVYNSKYHEYLEKGKSKYAHPSE
jgi:hypothetical protein